MNRSFHMIEICSRIGMPVEDIYATSLENENSPNGPLLETLSMSMPATSAASWR